MSQQFHTVSLEAHLPSLRHYALSLTRNRDSADDLVQDSVLRALNRQAMFEPGTNLRSWLFTIMHNIFCDGRRVQQRRGPHLPLGDWQDRMSLAPAQGTSVELAEVARSFERLSQPQQALLLMVGANGASYESAAAHFGVAVGTIKSRLFRARASLRLHQKGTRSGAGSPPASRATWASWSVSNIAADVDATGAISDFGRPGPGAGTFSTEQRLSQ